MVSVVEPDPFPRADPVGSARAPLPAAALDLIADLVAPGAAAADEHGVSRTTLTALAAGGLLGTPRPPHEQREVSEVIAGCDASTWFCWVQHQTPLRTLEAATAGPDTRDVELLRDRLLPGLRSGGTLAAVAFAHVRRPGPANPVATRVAGGWRLVGHVGLGDVMGHRRRRHGGRAGVGR